LPESEKCDYTDIFISINKTMDDWSDSVIEASPGTDAPPAAQPLALAFSGSGAEYFRIWIVNLLLTVITLGIYSAWAKTRRLQYFYRNTRLADASFDFRGDPKAILRGRILAVLLLAGSYVASGFSSTAALLTVILLLAGLPYILCSALRFRLANTWYRGLPFGFGDALGKAYFVYLLPVAVYMLPDVVDEIMPDSTLLDIAILLYVSLPLLHGATKGYQHRHLMYGDQRAGFALSNARLAKPYVPVILVLAAIFVLSAIAAVGLMLVTRSHPEAAVWLRIADDLGPFVVAAIICGLFILIGSPFITVRMDNLAWSATSFPGIRIACDMQARAYLRLQAENFVLTLLTLGLFRPFAAVRTWRYRLAHVHVHAPHGFELATMMAARPPEAAGGDGMADFLSVDLSW
jgi:uncharacterized membrane protein YjgN (DUF898 family)